MRSGAHDGCLDNAPRTCRTRASGGTSATVKEPFAPGSCRTSPLVIEWPVWRTDGEPELKSKKFTTTYDPFIYKASGEIVKQLTGQQWWKMILLEIGYIGLQI